MIPEEPQQPGPQTERHIELDVELSPGERLELIIEPRPDGEGLEVKKRILPPVETLHEPLRGVKQRPLNRAVPPRVRFNPQAMFILALVIYLATRFLQISTFPTSFTAGEAVHSVLAYDLLSHDLRDSQGELLPTFFHYGDLSGLGFSVYLSALPVIMFGQSVVIVRGMMALLTLLAAIWCGLILRDFFKAGYWWSAPLLLAVIPAWFMASRSGFAAAMAVTFYCGFLYYGLRSRLRGGRSVYLAILLAALTFYTVPVYLPVLVLSALALSIIKPRQLTISLRTGLISAGLLLLLALPFARFYFLHPDQVADVFYLNNSYWTTEPAFSQKLFDLAAQYLGGLNPAYWALANPGDSLLLRLAGGPHIPWIVLLLALLGIFVILRRHMDVPGIFLLAVLLSAPVAAAISQLRLEWALVLVIPVTLLSGLALSAVLEFLQAYRPFSREILTYVVSVVLAACSFVLLSAGLTQASLWTHAYGQDGLQYGAAQVFSLLGLAEANHPGTHFFVSGAWSYDTDLLRRFFLPDDQNISLSLPDFSLPKFDPDLEKAQFLLTAAEFQNVIDTGHFQPPLIENTISYPDGSPGFYLLRLKYRPDIGAIIQREKFARAAPVTDEVKINGQAVQVTHPPLEEDIAHFFDGDPKTVAKTRGLNPLELQFDFSTPRNMKGLVARVGSEKVRLTVTLLSADGKPAQTYSVSSDDPSEYKDVFIDFNALIPVKTLHFELLDVDADDLAVVHLWELTFSP